MTAEEEIAALNAALPKKYNSAEEEIAALNAELRGESAAHGVELANKKDELGFWERKRLELEEKTGKKTSWGDLALNKTIGFGIDEAAEANDEWREIQLMNGKIDDPGSIWSEARNMGISADDLATALEPAYIGKESFKDFIKAIKDMEETPAGLSDGPSNFSIIQHKFKGSVDPAVMKTRFADIAKSRLADRIKTREAAQSRLHGAEAQSGWGMFFSGLADMPSMLSKFFHPAAIVLSTGVDAHNRSTRLATDTYTLDAKGNPQIAKEYATDQDGNVLLDADGNPVVKRELRGETDDVALSKGAVGAITESLIWTKLGALAKPLRGLMLKIPGVDRLAAKLVKGSASAGEKLVNKLGQSSSGRLAMKTVAVLGDVEEKTHLGSLPSMIAKSRLTEFCDEVVGLNARPGEREAFGEWLNK
ncbi:MAG: hypothetical protein IKO55_12050, partial [Kiritimatiellae bacterium]|nr:hypothetical protein [Kiritimatiellia bacterium]